MSAAHPLSGDVLISRIDASGERFQLSRYPGIDQFTFATYDLALRMARGFAARHHVDVWYAADPGAATKVLSYRSSEIAG